MTVRRGVAALLLAFTVGGGVSGCTETEEPDEDVPSQQAPGQQEQEEQEEQDDDG